MKVGQNMLIIGILKFLLIFMYGYIIGCLSNMLIDKFIKKIELEEAGKDEKVTFLSKNFTFYCGCDREGVSLIPIVGYWFRRWHCPKCNQKLNKRYFVVELMTGGAFVLNVLVNGFNVRSFFECLVIAVLVIISIVDFKTFEIPIHLNAFILLIGVIVSIFDYRNIFEHIIGFFCVSSLLWAIIYFSDGRAMGGGDLKLMATCGLLLGWKVIIVSFVIGCVLGSVIHVIRMKVEDKECMLAFGPYLSMGIFVGMLYGNTIIEWYLGLMR